MAYAEESLSCGRDNQRHNHTRGSTLQEAIVVINQREDQYGNPENSFELIGKMWALALNLPEPISPERTAIMLALFKLARELHKHQHDNLVDCAAYIALCAECANGVEK